LSIIGGVNRVRSRRVTGLHPIAVPVAEGLDCLVRLVAGDTRVELIKTIRVAVAKLSAMRLVARAGVFRDEETR
jgi:hypothetical protein